MQEDILIKALLHLGNLAFKINEDVAASITDQLDYGDECDPQFRTGQQLDADEPHNQLSIASPDGQFELSMDDLGLIHHAGGL